MMSLLKQGIQLPIWTPERGSKAIRKHLADLRIPITHFGSPSLLLHDIGSPSHDLKLEDRVSALFSDEARTK
jgi:hypothetical protein